MDDDIDVLVRLYTARDALEAAMTLAVQQRKALPDQVPHSIGDALICVVTAIDAINSMIENIEWLIVPIPSESF